MTCEGHHHPAHPGSGVRVCWSLEIQRSCEIKQGPVYWWDVGCLQGKYQTTLQLRLASDTPETCREYLVDSSCYHSS